MTHSGHIGIDCGATRCRVAWSDPGRRVDFIGRGVDFSTDPQGCAQAIVEACQSLAEKAGTTLANLCDAQAYLGIAGLVTDEDAAILLQALPFKNATIEDKKRALAVGALGERDGFVAGLGTDSFVLKRKGEDLFGVGGWGLTLSDEASAAWLGREVLRRTLRAHDGLVPHTALTRAILDEFGGAMAIVEFARDATPREYSKLASGVIGSATVGDRGAQVIMQRGGTWIAQAFEQLGWTLGVPICMPGDLGAAYWSYLPETMQMVVEPAKGSAVDGALALVRTRT